MPCIYKFPRRRTVTIYTADHEMRTIPAGGVLVGGAVLPGLAIPLSALFD